MIPSAICQNSQPRTTTSFLNAHITVDASKGQLGCSSFILDSVDSLQLRPGNIKKLSIITLFYSFSLTKAYFLFVYCAACYAVL